MFTDRQQAGRLLAQKLMRQLPDLSANKQAPTKQLVVGVGYGGVPVAEQVARRLHLPLTAFAAEVIRSLSDDNADMGAVCSCGIVVFGDTRRQNAGHEHSYVGCRVKELSEKARMQERSWRTLAGLGHCPEIADKRVIVVEEGVMSGATTRAVLSSLKQLGAHELVIATPVILEKTKDELITQCNLIVSLIDATQPFALSEFYNDYHEVGDAEVIEALKQTALLSQRAVDLLATG